MEEIVSDVIETGVEIVATVAENPSKKGCFWMSIILVAIAIGVTLYFVL